MKLTDSQREALQKKVEKIESQTSGEIVPLVVRRSSPPGFGPDWLSSAVIFLGLVTVWGVEQISPFPLVLDSVLQSLALLLLLLNGVLFSPFVQRLFLSKAQRTFYVNQRAMAEFLSQGLTNTRGRSGVLIFVSLFEHKIQILVDQGISKKVTPEQWQRISQNAAQRLKKGMLFEALDEALDQVAPYLIEHFPRAIDDQNELGDAVREIE
jgi:putative membrane protein